MGYMWIRGQAGNSGCHRAVAAVSAETARASTLQHAVLPHVSLQCTAKGLPRNPALKALSRGLRTCTAPDTEIRHLQAYVPGLMSKNFPLNYAGAYTHRRPHISFATAQSNHTFSLRRRRSISAASAGAAADAFPPPNLAYTPKPYTLDTPCRINLSLYI